MSKRKKADQPQGDRKRHSKDKMQAKLRSAESGDVTGYIDTNGEVKPKPKIKTQLSQMTFPELDAEVNNEPSKTVPGLSMTILEMVKRHQAGQPIDQSKGPIYREGDEVIPDISQMDLVDRHAYMDSVADALVEVRERIAASAKNDEERAFLARVDEEVRLKMTEISKTVPSIEIPK